MSDTEIPLPEPFFEDWWVQNAKTGQNAKTDAYTADQMREYAAQCVAADRERLADQITAYLRAAAANKYAM